MGRDSIPQCCRTHTDSSVRYGRHRGAGCQGAQLVPGGAEAKGCSALQCQASSPQQSPGQVLAGQQLGKPPWLVPSCETSYVWWTSVLGSGAMETSPEIPQATYRSHCDGLWRGGQEKSPGGITQCTAFCLSFNPKQYHSGTLNHLSGDIRLHHLRVIKNKNLSSFFTKNIYCFDFYCLFS